MKNQLLKIFSLGLCVLMLCSCQAEKTPDDSAQSQEWQPNYDEPWNFTPAQTKIDREIDWGYDIVFSTQEATYTTDVEIIRAVAVNQTGERMYVSSNTPFIERFYMSAFPNPYDSLDAWVRLPYYPEHTDSVFSSCESATNEMWFSFNPKYLKNNCVLTPGEYRMVVYLADGPHYAYFDVVESQP